MARLMLAEHVEPVPTFLLAFADPLSRLPRRVEGSWPCRAAFPSIPCARNTRPNDAGALTHGKFDWKFR